MVRTIGVTIGLLLVLDACLSAPVALEPGSSGGVAVQGGSRTTDGSVESTTDGTLGSGGTPGGMVGTGGTPTGGVNTAGMSAGGSIGTGGFDSAPPRLSVDPTHLDFGQLPQDLRDTWVPIRITNLGDTYAGPFPILPVGSFVSADECKYALAPGASCNISAKCNNGYAVIKDQRDAEIAISFKCVERPSDLQLSPQRWDFGERSGSYEKDFELTNTGPSSLENIRINNGGPYFFISTECNTTLRAGERCTIHVRFDPTGLVESQYESLTVSRNGNLYDQYDSAFLAGYIPVRRTR